MSLLEDIEGFVSGKLAIIQTVFSILKLETKLAGLSIFPLVLNLCFFLIVLSSSWITAMLLLGYGLFLALNSVFWAMVILILLHSLALLGLFKYLLFNIKNMSFEKTRAYILKRENGYDAATKTSDGRNQHAGKDPRLPAKEERPS